VKKCCEAPARPAADAGWNLPLALKLSCDGTTGKFPVMLRPVRRLSALAAVA